MLWIRENKNNKKKDGNEMGEERIRMMNSTCGDTSTIHSVIILHIHTSFLCKVAICREG